MYNFRYVDTWALTSKIKTTVVMQFILWNFIVFVMLCHKSEHAALKLKLIFKISVDFKLFQFCIYKIRLDKLLFLFYKRTKEPTNFYPWNNLHVLWQQKTHLFPYQSTIQSALVLLLGKVPFILCGINAPIPMLHKHINTKLK